MVYTIFLAVMMMAGLFLMLWAEVSFIQDKRFASSHIPIQRLKMFWVLIFFGYNWKIHLSFIISTCLDLFFILTDFSAEPLRSAFLFGPSQ